MICFYLHFPITQFCKQLSQSTLQLSGNNNNDNNQPQTSTNHHPHSHTSFGARYLFGQRRSGEDNAKNQLKIARTLLSRTTTQGMKIFTLLLH